MLEFRAVITHFGGTKLTCYLQRDQVGRSEFELREMMWFRLVRAGLLFLLVVVLAGCRRQPDADPPTLETIEGRVSELRRLKTLKPAAKDFLTTQELRQRLEEDLSADYSEQEAHDDVLIYVAFELVEPDLDLYNLTLDLYSEQVAGFYDPETEEMVVITGEEPLGALERLTYSHEYTHVLQDQHFDLEALGFTDEDDEGVSDSEERFAGRSLVEGDATLLMQQYALQYFDTQEFMQVIDQSVEYDSSVLDSSPEVIRETLLFPYDAGLRFVVSLFQQGGWSAVDAAYANPPVSTEQILHPERYPGDAPQYLSLPPLTDTLGSGWRLVDEDVLGELGLQLYLGGHVDTSEAETAAEGWGGDRYAVHWREDETAFVLALRLAWDTPAEAAEFYAAYTRFAQDRFAGAAARSSQGRHLLWFGDDALLLAQNDQDETLILIAPDAETLDALLALFPDF